MRATDLDLKELLHFEPKGGGIEFAGQRALLMDAVALGILRKELIADLGHAGARGILTRFGYAHGWRTAESMKSAFPWDERLDWQQAGPILHSLQGLVQAEPSPLEGRDADHVVDAIWTRSYEAEQHLMHLGRADEAVCWTLCGFASGYLSCVRGQEFYCVEDRCVGKGDAVCHVVGRSREDWGEAAASFVPFYRSACLETTLGQVTEELKRVERTLHAGLPRPEPEVGSEAMAKVLDLARRVARVDTTVLITGESGVGKERIARLIHAESARAGGPFVAINCGAVPETLLESELFGHAKGAFTGAAQDRPGLFEAASGGTLLLDEIGEVPPAMQVKLLRVLQEREVRRVGENRNRRIDVRVLAATNRELLAEVHAARFRQDLYYRLRVIELKVPALRDRRADLLALARAFLAQAGARLEREVAGFTPEAASQLLRYGWPGNVRELENAVERAVVLARGSRIEVDDLPEEIGKALPMAYAAGEVRPLDEVERDYILALLRANAGNKVLTARQLRIGTATLYRKLNGYRARSGIGASVPE